MLSYVEQGGQHFSLSLSPCPMTQHEQQSEKLQRLASKWKSLTNTINTPNNQNTFINYYMESEFSVTCITV